ncbi:MAG: 2-oxoacid:acceptor oxidoreductase family protein, partial [Alphaproteobacteria bacterium]
MSQITQHPDAASREEDHETVESVVVRFAGDSGDGVQLTGSLFTLAAALAGNDLATFPDFPAEIRAPVGTTFGVSAYQVNFVTRHILTHGDEADVLVAMNPAALKVNLENLTNGGLVILDSGAFVERNLRKAGYESDPRADGTLTSHRVMEIDVSKLTLAAVEPFGLGKKAALRGKNMWLLGLVYWMYGRDRQPVVERLKRRFAGKGAVADANIAALNAGHAFGETMEIS